MSKYTLAIQVLSEKVREIGGELYTIEVINLLKEKEAASSE